MALNWCRCGRRKLDRSATCRVCRQSAQPARIARPVVSLEQQIAHNLRVIRQTGRFRIVDGRDN